MLRLFPLLVALALCLSCRDAFQPSAPDSDTAVYEAVINQFLHCTDERMNHLYGRQLIVQSTTVPQRQYVFGFDFARAQKILPILLRTGETFYRKSDWAAFLATINTGQFTVETIEQPINPACCCAIIQTSQQIRHYLNTGDEFESLKGKFSRFGGIINLSKVVYSADKQKAVCYYSNIWGGKEGYGKVVFLEYCQSVWCVVGIAQLWIA